MHHQIQRTDGNASTTVNADADININTVAAIYLDHSSVDLGTLSSSDVTIDDSGASLPTMTPVGDNGPFNVYAYANADYDVTVEVTDDNVPSGLNGNLQVDSGSWESVISGGSSASTTVIGDTDGSNAGTYSSQSLDYRYQTDLTDQPGEYTVTMTYTVSTG